MQLDQTLVFYMGMGGLASICENLIEHGMSRKMPIAIISKGTTPEQRIVRGELNTILNRVAEERLETPTLIIIGRVVALAR